MAKERKVVAFECVDIKTDEVVYRVDLHRDYGERELEKIESGLVRKTDTERFFVREVLS